MDNEGGRFQVQLTSDEALVLFEWLSKRNEDDALEPTIEHWSEQLVLWNVLAQLEKTLAEPFDPKYRELLNGARERLVADISPEDRKRVK